MTRIELRNCDVVEKPDYYTLQDGTQLEDALRDFLHREERVVRMIGVSNVGAFWDACIYLHRAGHKDGEPWWKDVHKVFHYCRFIARGNEYLTATNVCELVVDTVRAIRSEHTYL